MTAIEEVHIDSRAKQSYNLQTKGMIDEACIAYKSFSICPKLVINAEHYGLVLAPRLKKKDTIKFGRPICNPWGPMFKHLLIS
jgi:hypothetical protein